MNTRPSTCRLVAFAGLATGVLAANAGAQTLSWNNAAGGFASTAGNWNPVQVPTAANNLLFGLNNTYSVTWNSTVTASNQQEYNRGVVTLQVSPPHSITNQFKVGRAAADVATATLTTGTLNVGTFTVIGQDAGSLGTLNVNDDDADLLSANDVIVGQAGTGALNITNGGLVSSGDEIRIGNLSTGVGNVTVNGISLAPLARSLLRTTNSSTGIIAVGATGTGELHVIAGAEVNCANRLMIGAGPTTNGRVDVTGTGNLGGSHLVASDVEISSNTSGSAGGIGELDVGPSAVVDITGTISLGDPQGGSGRLIMTGGTLSCDSLICDTTGHAVLGHTSGEIRITGGIAIAPADNFNVDGLLASPPLWRLLNDSSHTVQGGLVVANGGGNGGAVRIEEASRMTVLGRAILGSGVGAVGSTTVTGVNSLFNVQGTDLTVGQNGQGTLTISSGGTTNATGSVFIARLAGSSGQVTLTGVGSQLLAGQWIVVGGSTGGTGGPGQLSIGDGTLVQCADFNVRPGSNLVMQGGTLTASSTASSLGQLSLTQATINAPLFIMTGSSMNASGTVNASMSINAASTITATGPLTMGNASSTTGFDCSGTLAVSAFSVTLLDSNLAFSKTTTISNGVLNAPNGLSLNAQSTLSGGGTINCAVNNQGSITAISSSGLVFNNELSGTGTFGGTTIRFGPSGSLTQGATFSCNVLNSGTIAPGRNLPATPAQLNITGQFLQLAGGTLDIDLLDCGESDVVNVAQTTSLTGRLHLTAKNGYVPRNHHTFRILNSPTINGSFGTVTLTNFPPGYSAAVAVHVGGVDVEIIADCLGDFDGDGFVSGNDFDQFSQAFEEGSNLADMDGDCFVTGVDFDTYVEAFESGC